MAHEKIASVSEPWLMLPIVYAFKKEGIISEYSHITCYAALEDFISCLPNGKDDYYSEIITFVTSLYEKQCKKDETYFLDKTPRYYLIIPEISKFFPDAKFIFLFRNPVHIMSSVLQTWCDGKFRTLYRFHQDLTYGPGLLSAGYELLRDKAYAIRYEDYLMEPAKLSREICDYLEISFDENMISGFVNQYGGGRMGDQSGIRKYKTISSEPLSKWKETFNTAFRKQFCRRYIKQLDEDILQIQGYDKALLLEEIDSLGSSCKGIVSDVIDFLYATFVRYSKANLFIGSKTNKWSKGKHLT